MKLNFKENYILENDVVKLSPLKAIHFDNLLEYSVNEPELWKYNAGGANGEDNLKKYISNALHQREEEKEYPFIVFDKRKSKFVGSTRFYGYRELNNRIEIGHTWYGKETHGNGINKNCKYLMLQFAFEKIEMERVGFAASNFNKRSIHAMKSIGCTVEGIFRNFSLDNYGNTIDCIFLSILKNEWLENIKEDLKVKIATYTNG